jgi:hypothetical protein
MGKLDRISPNVTHERYTIAIVKHSVPVCDILIPCWSLLIQSEEEKVATELICSREYLTNHYCNCMLLFSAGVHYLNFYRAGPGYIVSL